jgi:hypothetical protein
MGPEIKVKVVPDKNREERKHDNRNEEGIDEEGGMMGSGRTKGKES